MCVFGRFSTEGRFNLIVPPEPGSFTSKDIYQKEKFREIDWKVRWEKLLFVLPHALLFSFVKKYLIFYC